MAGYAALVFLLAPRGVSASQFFRGRARDDTDPSLPLLVASAAITWIFAKSISNAANLSRGFGILGGVGYALYYLSFVVAAVVVYAIRRRGGHPSLAAFLAHKYGPGCARFFLLAVAVRLLNEVWSNTKVAALYFGAEGTEGYWLAVVTVTAITLAYSLRSGLRGSLITDAGQMVLAGGLLALVVAAVGPSVVRGGLTVAGPAPTPDALTFCALALVQVLSYPFHDPVLTDRAFITRPRVMLVGFALAGLVGGAFIILFGLIGIYGIQRGLPGDPTVAVPAALGLPQLLVFNAIMLTSAGSTLDSTLSSTSKLGVLDWPRHAGEPAPMHLRRARLLMVAVAVLGNMPLLGVYLGDRIGPAIIAATTISGTMVMGLAPIFLLSWIRPARSASFHLAFWPGMALGVLRVLEGATGAHIFPTWVALGSGRYAIDLGVNVWGLALCTAGYLAGAAMGRLGLGVRSGA